MFKPLGTAAMSVVLQQSLPKKVAETFAETGGVGIKRFCETRYLCESPIEEIMLAYLATTPVEDHGSKTYISDSGYEASIHDIQSGEEFPNKPFVVVPQFPIARFRLDFFVVAVKGRRAWQFDIECDGIEFHGGIEKRRADSERDTYLARMGIRTFRYFGQQIYKGDAQPIADIFSHILVAEAVRKNGST